MTYNYTKPRVPIAGMYSGPGPQQYMLPSLFGQDSHDPRSGKFRGPAYTIGCLLRDFPSDSVGPKYYPEKMLNRGPDFAPAYSFGLQYGSKQAVTPGPSDYNCIPSDALRYLAAPQYSIAARTNGMRFDQIPGPNRYTVDPMMGVTVRSGKPTCPKYSMCFRHMHGSYLHDLSKTPGAANYILPHVETYRTRCPVFSMAGKHPDLNVGPRPGPASYAAHLVWIHKSQCPTVPLGLRHSPYMMPLITERDVC